MSFNFVVLFSLACKLIGVNFSREFQRHTKAQRQKSLDEMHTQLKKYISSRLQPALVSESS